MPKEYAMMQDVLKALVPNSYFRPAELLSIFKKFLIHTEIKLIAVSLKGIYLDEIRFMVTLPMTI